ncbi:MAG: rRNA maturation RNase YbeY [Rickettsiaceae bacterium]|nr:rRNA maturation RNase YbeY [Rickettsiaceae bacterium]
MLRKIKVHIIKEDNQWRELPSINRKFVKKIVSLVLENVLPSDVDSALVIKTQKEIQNQIKDQLEGQELLDNEPAPNATLLLKNKGSTSVSLPNIFEITILLASNERMKELNKKFLNKDKPTNVLAFPEQDLDYKNLGQIELQNEMTLGDVAFGFEKIKKEAKVFQTTFENHFTHLLIHATLHLLGYDHKNDHDHSIMSNIEIFLLDQLGIGKPRIYGEQTR